MRQLNKLERSHSESIYGHNMVIFSLLTRSCPSTNLLADNALKTDSTLDSKVTPNPKGHTHGKRSTLCITCDDPSQNGNKRPHLDCEASFVEQLVEWPWSASGEGVLLPMKTLSWILLWALVLMVPFLPSIASLLASLYLIQLVPGALPLSCNRLF